MVEKSDETINIQTVDFCVSLVAFMISWNIQMTADKKIALAVTAFFVLLLDSFEMIYEDAVVTVIVI